MFRVGLLVHPAMVWLGVGCRVVYSHVHGVLVVLVHGWVGWVVTRQE